MRIWVAGRSGILAVRPDTEEDIKAQKADPDPGKVLAGPAVDQIRAARGHCYDVRTWDLRVIKPIQLESLVGLFFLYRITVLAQRICDRRDPASGDHSRNGVQGALLLPVSVSDGGRLCAPSAAALFGAAKGCGQLHQGMPGL